MTTFLALYLQAPFWVWLAAGASFAALNLATGQSLLLWPALAAGALAVLKSLGLKLGLAFDLPLFVVLTGGGMLLGRRLPAPKAPKAKAAVPRPPEPARRAPSPMAGASEHNARLIGRIARTTGRFANGVGRVWIDGSEWAAELGGGEDDLAPDTPVRVMRVIGAVKLQVCTLN